ncbi:MAG: cytochrome c [Rhodospirillales bacterium]|nr:cytochrome c [Rhodospirillales bacterium]
MIRALVVGSVLVIANGGPAQAQAARSEMPWMMGPGMMDERMGSGMMGDGEMGMMRGDRGHLMQRHMAYMRGALPNTYAGLANPLRPTEEVLSRGAELYRSNCASCHGLDGRGTGEAGKALMPPPANIAATARMPMGDNFLYWSIAEGGVAFDTAMPAFRDALQPEEIWSVITWLRAGLPSSPPH